MTKKQAINYLKCSGFSDDQVITLVKALADIKDIDNIELIMKLVTLAIETKEAGCDDALLKVTSDDVEFTCVMHFCIK